MAASPTCPDQGRGSVKACALDWNRTRTPQSVGGALPAELAGRALPFLGERSCTFLSAGTPLRPRTCPQGGWLPPSPGKGPIGVFLVFGKRKSWPRRGGGQGVPWVWMHPNLGRSGTAWAPGRTERAPGGHERVMWGTPGNWPCGPVGTGVSLGGGGDQSSCSPLWQGSTWGSRADQVGGRRKAPRLPPREAQHPGGAGSEQGVVGSERAWIWT